MTIEKGVRLMGGTFVVLSVALAHFHNINWLWFTLFVGLNLAQSGLTNWCPAMWILGKLGLKKASCPSAPRK